MPEIDKKGIKVNKNIEGILKKRPPIFFTLEMLLSFEITKPKLKKSIVIDKDKLIK